MRQRHPVLEQRQQFIGAAPGSLEQHWQSRGIEQDTEAQAGVQIFSTLQHHGRLETVLHRTFPRQVHGVRIRYQHDTDGTCRPVDLPAFRGGSEMCARGSRQRRRYCVEQHHDLAFEIEPLQIVDAVLRQHETVTHEHQRRLELAREVATKHERGVIAELEWALADRRKQPQRRIRFEERARFQLHVL
jgi:hypothetical protein